MKKKLKSLVIILSLFSLCLLSSCVAVQEEEVGEGLPSGFEVHFIDVGQADSALVVCDGKAMLIDGGNDADSDTLYTYLEKYGISELEYIIASHAHDDHIGGLAGAIERATPKAVLCPVEYDKSVEFGVFLKALDKVGAEITIPEPDDSFYLGEAKVDILACNTLPDANNSSIVLTVTYDDVSFLFTGDIERDVEREIIDDGYDLSCDVLKVSHHGSISSSSYYFLNEADPEYAVISAGYDNPYGHPHDEVLDRLSDADIEIYRTDVFGDIIFKVINGELVIETEKEGELLEVSGEYILNTSSGKFHLPDCAGVRDIKEKNKKHFEGSAAMLTMQGYTPCGTCLKEGFH